MTAIRTLIFVALCGPALASTPGATDPAYITEGYRLLSEGRIIIIELTPRQLRALCDIEGADACNVVSSGWCLVYWAYGPVEGPLLDHEVGDCAYRIAHGDP